MGTSAKINQISTAVGGSEAVLGDLTLDQLLLEGVVGEQFQCLCLTQQNPFVRLLLLGVSANFFLDPVEVSLRDAVVADERIVKETLIQGWAVAQPSPVKILETLPQQVRAGMPEDLLPGIVLKGQQF